MNYYLYKITFEEVPHFYIGSRRCPDNKTPETDTAYTGTPSGKTNKGYWDVYTTNKHIFCYGLSWEKAREIESEVIKGNIKNKYCLNEHYGVGFSAEALERGIRNREERRKNDPEFDRDYKAKQREAKLGEKNSNYGTMWITDGETAKRIKRGDQIPDGFWRGTDEQTRAKLSEALSGEKNPNYGTMWITDGETSRRIPKGNPIPEGFWPGRDKQTKTKMSEAQSGEKQHAYGKMWITNGETSRRIPKGESIPEGWRMGRTVKALGTVCITNGETSRMIPKGSLIPEGFHAGRK